MDLEKLVLDIKDELNITDFFDFWDEQDSYDNICRKIDESKIESNIKVKLLEILNDTEKYTLRESYINMICYLED